MLAATYMYMYLLVYTLKTRYLMAFSSHALCGFFLLRMLCSEVMATFASSFLLDKISMDKTDSNGFFSRRLVCVHVHVGLVIGPITQLTHH